MNILFLHQNFPAQFKHLAPALVAQGHTVVAMPRSPVESQQWQGVQLFPYTLTRGNGEDTHAWVINFEAKVLRAEACLQTALALKAQGFNPDVIIAHPAWGESLFMAEVWPQARIGIYCEYYNQLHGADVGFDPEFGFKSEAELCRIRLKNAANLLALETAHAGIAPTQWQANTFPTWFQTRISVVHDGIDTQAIQPNPQVYIRLGEFTLTQNDEVITFVNRDLEPYRGYHSFMRALPVLLKRRPDAHILIVGGNGVSYGAPPSDGRSWKDIFIAEVRPQISATDWARVHFLGNIPYESFIALLQLSSVHVYLTYPFVLSWSLLEAMSAGCAIVASNTAPVAEVIHDKHTGWLVDFFDSAGLAEAVCALLANPQERQRLGHNARAYAVANYDLKTMCLPKQLAWVEQLASA